ncbi:MAG: hypothetical protein S4CHLAM2_06900 [Chlamydiales bacterium]|nr:hypothetical protein [Chlamydiales bacterium]
MKKFVSLLTVCALALGVSMSASETETPESSYAIVREEPYNPYDPSAPVAGTNAAMRYVPLGIGVLTVAAIAAIVIASSNGNSSSHGHAL